MEHIGNRITQKMKNEVKLVEKKGKVEKKKEFKRNEENEKR